MISGDYLLEKTESVKTVFLVRWTSYPTDIMITIILQTKFSRLQVEELYAIIVYEYGSRPILGFVSRDGDFKRLDCWVNNTG